MKLLPHFEALLRMLYRTCDGPYKQRDLHWNFICHISFLRLWQILNHLRPNNGNRIASDAIQCILLFYSFSKSNDCHLGSAVGKHSSITLLPRNGGNIYNSSIVLLEHEWQNCTTSMKDSFDVDINDEVKICWLN